MKDFAKIVHGSNGHQVVAYIEYSEKDSIYNLCVMVGFPTPDDNHCNIDSGCLEEMEAMLDAFDTVQADAILLRFEADRRRLAAAMNAKRKEKFGDNVRQLHP